jgi:hypothetical protein
MLLPEIKSFLQNYNRVVQWSSEGLEHSAMQWIEYITDYHYFAISFEFILRTFIHVHVLTSSELLSVLMNDIFL